MKRKLILPVLGVLALLAMFSFQSRSAFADSNAMVRVVHASPAAGTVDVYVDGKALLTNFEFGKVTDYVSVPAGSHKIEVSPAGKGESAAVITQDVTVSAGMAYTVAAIGTKDSGFGLTPFVDDNRVSGAMASVRVYHLSPDAGPVNVATGGNDVITGLTYKNASDYLAVPANSYTFNVTATDANATVPVNATLKSGTVTSVFAVGLLKGDPKLQFVAAQVTGMPGMPNTGSDPTSLPAQQMPIWLVLGGLAVLVLGSSAVARVATARRK